MALSAGSVEIRLFAELARLQSDMKKANKVVEDAMGGIKKTVRGATTVFNNLAGAFGSAQIIKLADEYKRFDAQLKLSTKTLEEYNEAYANTIRIGRTAQSDIGAIGVLYSRLNNNLRDFNVTQREVSDVTETISLALRVNNATVQETNSTMLQLSQSFGSGRLNGQEFLAVAEGAPALLRQVAKAMNVNYGALKDLSAEGKITRDILLKAWTDPAYLEGLRAQVREVGTVTSSITVLMNNLKQYIGESDKATGATRALSSGILLISDNINLLVSGALAFGVAKFIKWTQGQYAAIVASKLLAKETAQNAQLQILNAEKTALAAKVKSDLLKLELVAEQNKQNAVLKTTQIERLNLIEKIKYEQQTLLVIQAARSEAIAINNAALAKQNDAIRTLESVRNMATLSGTIYAQKQAQDQLNAALAKRGLIMTELANLGRQQASVNAQITASTLALQKAEQALTITEKVRGVNLANNASLTTRLVHDYDKAVNVTNNVTKATSAAATAVRGFGTILSAFGGWIGLAITAIVLFGDKIYKAMNPVSPMLEQIRAKAKEMNDELAKTPDIVNKVAASQLEQLGIERSALEQKLAADERALRDIERSEKLGFGGDPLRKALLTSSIAQTKSDLNASLALYKDFVTKRADAEKAASRGVSQQQIDDAQKLLAEYKTQANLRKEYELEVQRIIDAGKITGKDVTSELALAKTNYEKATGALKTRNKELKDAESIHDKQIKQQNELNDLAKTYFDITTKTHNKIIEQDRELTKLLEEDLNDRKNKNIDEMEALQEKIDATRLEVELHGMNKEAIEAVAIARKLDTVETLRSLGLNTSEIEKEIEMQYELLQLQVKKSQLDANQKDTIKDMKDGFSELKTAINGYSRDMTRSFADFIFGTKTSFSEMINSMLKDLARIALQKAIFDPIAEGVVGYMDSNDGIGGSIKSFFGFANGGIMSSSGKMPLNRYSMGGIANSPQLAMFGEGRMNEAYVPLPDGKTIPVTMKGGAGNQVNVNVYVTGGSSDVQSNEQDGRNLGNAIKAAVQAELIKQKRQGGLLA